MKFPKPGNSLCYLCLSVTLTVASLTPITLCPEDVDGGKAWKGLLAGVIVGTVLSLGVPALKATFVAGIVAAGVSLIPKVDPKTLSDEGVERALSCASCSSMLSAVVQHVCIQTGPELPGAALVSAAAEGSKGLEGTSD